MRNVSLSDLFRDHKKRIEKSSLRELFQADDGRAQKFSITTQDLLFDYSKQYVDQKAMDALFELAKDADVEGYRNRMFGGEHINETEDRAVLHVALRNPATEHIISGGEDVMPKVHAELAKMRRFSDGVRSGAIKGQTGKKFKTVVNIGIGGSQLGPEMLSQALGYYGDRSIDLQFVSNVDGDEIADVLQSAHPETTLFLVASKTFTTDETMTNARSARAWIKANLGIEATAKHFAAISTNLEEVEAFGINPENVFGFWQWVGGRYSVGAAIGLPVMISVGWDYFREFLNGMHAADEHFRTANLSENIPVIMGLLDAWNGSVLGSQAKVIAPYSHFLKRLPAYLQQLVMESNGKSVRMDGSPAIDQTSMAVMGQAGTDAQHAYFQQVHQGNFALPVDFIGFTRARYQLPEHQRKLNSNMIAQAEALAFGKSTEEMLEEGIDDIIAKHKTMPGNKPSNTFLFKDLTPYAVGQLIALYEHSVFVQGVIWGINSYDQWGVELGKKLAGKIEREFRLGLDLDHDGSTQQLIDYVRENSDS